MNWSWNWARRIAQIRGREDKLKGSIRKVIFMKMYIPAGEYFSGG